MVRRIFALGFLFVFTITSCATAGFHEMLRGIAGNSTRILHDTRPNAVVREFACRLEECGPKVAAILTDMQAYVYAREPGLIAIYVSDQDTTPVGIFLSSAGIDTTKIEVSSPSTFARELISRKLFSSLEAKLKAKKIEVQLDAVEGK
jgi:hypothetical protein